jgi:SAM-dependent methyltransferase
MVKLVKVRYIVFMVNCLLNEVVLMNIKKFDTYLSLCTEVYDLSKPKPPEDAYAFYRSYVEDSKGAVLEPMCGTGRFLLPLMEEGFDVHGFDASEYMLEALRLKAKGLNLEPNIWKGFVQDLNRVDKYDLIFIPGGSFGIITDKSQVKESLKIFYNHMNKGGILLFEVESLKSIPALGVWRGSVFYRKDGLKLIASMFTALEKDICTSIQKYELVEWNAVIKTEVEELKIRIYEKDDLLKVLQEIGFKDVNIIKTFDKSKPADEGDKVFVYECRK